MLNNANGADKYALLGFALIRVLRGSRSDEHSASKVTSLCRLSLISRFLGKRSREGSVECAV